MTQGKTFEIRVTDTNNDNDFCTTEYSTQELETGAGDIMGRIEHHINHEGVRFAYASKFIVIEPASDDEGYMYDIWESEKAYLRNEEDGEGESIDGGQCTGTLSDAIGMALDHA